MSEAMEQRQTLGAGSDISGAVIDQPRGDNSVGLSRFPAKVQLYMLDPSYAVDASKLHCSLH